jgi:adenosylcobinamide kinase/adenosylcobinamide-phosphate guanylyltransferase
MGKIIFVVGGSRSGKSSYALRLAQKRRGKVAFVATGEGNDKEMKQRILLHQAGRPAHWQTFEEPLDISATLGKLDKTFSTVIIDCLTLYVSNLLLKRHSGAGIEKNIEKTIRLLNKAPYVSLVVSNEVGLGVVPASKLGRKFRDIAGRANQQVAAAADTVFFMVSGLPLRLKGESRRARNKAIF